jgi:hypothetical protein
VPARALGRCYMLQGSISGAVVAPGAEGNTAVSVSVSPSFAVPEAIVFVNTT